VRPRSGFTLIEMMVVVAIFAILVTLAVAAWSAIQTRGAAQNAARDFGAAIAMARSRAIDRGTEVWLIVFTDVDASGQPGGSGAYFVYEDPDGNFTTGGTRNWNNFDPGANPPFGNTEGGEGDKLLSETFLDSYGRKSARFAVSGGVQPGAPFTGLAPSACSFCAGNKGALIFRPDGSVGLVRADGTSAPPASFDVAGRAASLGIRATTGPQEYVFAVSAPTGFYEVYTK